MPSLIYKALEPAIRKAGHKAAFSMPLPQMREYLELHKGQQSARPPAWIYASFSVSEREALGSTVYVIRPKAKLPCCFKKRQSQTPVVLYLHGGGFMFEANVAHWVAVEKIIRETSAEVWFCVYPLLPDSTIYDASAVVFETYLQMLEIYAENRVSVAGDSAGAILTLSLAHWLSKPQIALPQPRQIILISPAQIAVRNPEIRAQMETIDSRDIMLSTLVMDSLDQLMPARPGYDAFYELPLEGDFSKFPPTTVFSGTEEIFYPLMDDFLERLRDDLVSVTYFQGLGLCHCWPLIPLAPECERGFQQIIRVLKR